MTREQVSKIFDGATDEQIGRLLDLNSTDIGKAKGDYNDIKSQLATANDNLQKAQNTISELEKAKDDADKLTAELEKYKQAEQERLEAEKTATAEKAFADRFENTVKDTKFINDITKNGIFAEFKTALKDEKNAGKSDADIFTAITKDRTNIFANPNPLTSTPSSKSIDTASIDDDTARRVMGLAPKK